MKSKFEITNCQCGKKHIADIDNIVVENGAINRLPEVINGYGAKKALGRRGETRGRFSWLISSYFFRKSVIYH